MILPDPIARRTRATAVLRRPVPRNSEVSAIEKLTRDRERRGILGSVRVLAALVDFQFREQLRAEAVLRNHAFHGVVDQLLGMTRANLRDGAILFATLPP